MLFFQTRSAARAFAAGSRKVVDRGSSFGDKRWGVKVI